MSKCENCKSELPMHRLGCPEAKGETALYAKIEQLEAELAAIKRPMEAAGFKAKGMAAVGKELIDRDLRITKLEAELIKRENKISKLYTKNRQFLTDLAAFRWIPVGERLPEENEPKNRAKRLYFSEPTHNMWAHAYDYENYRWPPMPKAATHYMLMPIPPLPPQEDKT